MNDSSVPLLLLVLIISYLGFRVWALGNSYVIILSLDKVPYIPVGSIQ